MSCPIECPLEVHIFHYVPLYAALYTVLDRHIQLSHICVSRMFDNETNTVPLTKLVNKQHGLVHSNAPTYTTNVCGRPLVENLIPKS